MVVARQGMSVRLVVVPGEVRPNTAHSSPDPQSADPQSYGPQAAHCLSESSEVLPASTNVGGPRSGRGVAVVFVRRQSSAGVRVSSLHLVGSRVLVKSSLG